MSEPTLEDIEAETRAIEAKLIKLGKKPPAPAPKRDGDKVRSIIAKNQSSSNIAQDHPAWTDSNGRTWYRPVRQSGQSIDQWGWTHLPEYAHPDYKMPWSNPHTPLGKLEAKMDKRRRQMEKVVIETGSTTASPAWVVNKGRYEGYGDAIATLRNSSLKEEIERSNKRLEIE